MYQMLIGIEHLMTGLRLAAPREVRFERESASVIRLVSNEPFAAYWPAKTAFLTAVEVPDTEPVKYSGGEVEWFGQRAAESMRTFDKNNSRSQWADSLEPAVIKAMRAKHGANAELYIMALRWSAIDRCYFYSHNNMLCGVEPDGYIHT